MAKIDDGKTTTRAVRGSVTREDVARVAGVAGSTVSLALRGDFRVKSDTRRLIEMVAKQLNYRPLASARALSSGRTNAIAVVLSRSAFATPAAFSAYAIAFNVICNTLASHNYHMSVVPRPDVVPSSGKKSIAPFFQESAVDGAILILQPEPSLARAMDDVMIPYVIMNDGPANGLSCVFLNECRAAELAVEHMVSLGHKRILYTGRSRPSFREKEFERGYLRAMAAAKLRAFPGWDSDKWGDDMSVSEFLNYILEMLRGPNPPTAIITWDTEDATEVIGCLMKHGLTVPGDVSVAALQNIGWETARKHGESIMPSITCTANAQAKMATVAVEKLLSMIGHSSESTNGSVILEPELVVCESTGPCPV